MTPARNPRTECFCHPVVFIIAAIVAPPDDCSIAMTCDCFELGWLFADLRLLGIWAEGIEALADDADFTGDRLFADFDIEILHSVDDGVTPHHRSPTAAITPAGRESQGAFRRSRLEPVLLCPKRKSSLFCRPIFREFIRNGTFP